MVKTPSKRSHLTKTLICKSRVKNNIKQLKTNALINFKIKLDCVFDEMFIWLYVHTSAQKHLFHRKAHCWLETHGLQHKTSSSLSHHPEVQGLPHANCRCIQWLDNYCFLFSQVPNFLSPGQGSIIPQLFFGCFSAVFCRTLHSAL